MNATPTAPASARSGRPTDSALGPDGLLSSDLWLDQPNAGDEIERRLVAGALTPAHAAGLRQFLSDGYLTFEPRLPVELFDELDADVERLWSEQPSSVAFAYNSLLTRFSGDDGQNRRPSCRVADLHAFSEAARALYLHEEIHAWIELVLGEPVVATQSLYFEWGSQQALHRDPMHVRMERPSHLLAVWIACEDITPECGPLVYVPGSHRLPYFEFEPGRYVFDHQRDGVDGIRAAEAWDREHCARAGLAPAAFTPKRGEVLLWHHSLLHGGSLPREASRTRKSFVVHFTTRAHKRTTANTYVDPFVARLRRDAAREPVVYSTDRLLGAAGPRGFDSPLHARCLDEPRELYERLLALREDPFWRFRSQVGRALRRMGWRRG